VAPLDRANVDTDAIIPKQFLKSIKRSGFGPNAFDEWRYMDHGEPGQDCTKRIRNPNFVLNQERYQGASILLARSNFGCGSSREHAPQAIAKWGVQAIVAVSYSEIFHGNCVAMGLPAVRVSQADSEAIQSAIEADPKVEVTVDLNAMQVKVGAKAFACQLGDGPRKQFLTGQWDALGELVDGLPQVRAAAKKLPYLNNFA
jgi:3-isopropylmalate/(R)-2-methylmalate dehydratase small subunit